MIIVGLAGPKGSGKDTAYEILKKKSRIYAKLSFAGPLKQISSDIFNLPMGYFEKRELKERQLKEPITLTKKLIKAVLQELPNWLPQTEGDVLKYSISSVSIVGIEGRIVNTPRELLQIIGTDLIRDRVYSNWHIEATLGEYALSKLDDSKNYAVTDVRFLNELEAILNLPNGEVYYIERPEAEDVLGNSKHASELESKKIKEKLDTRFIVKNDGSLADLEKLVSDTILTPGSAKAKKAAKKPAKSKFKFVERVTNFKNGKRE